MASPALVRLTTDAPLSYIQQETPFALTRPLHLVFGPDEPFMGDISPTVRDFHDRTRDYWREWVRRLSIAYEWQEAIIRAAITSSYANFEETGGIVAALTTSLPEAPHSGRNWDYRYCWLRDAYFVVKALNAIGVTRTMEQYIAYILVHRRPTATLTPCYGIVPKDSHRMDRARLSRALKVTVRCVSAMPRWNRCSMMPMAASSWRRRRCSSTGGCRVPGDEALVPPA